MTRLAILVSFLFLAAPAFLSAHEPARLPLPDEALVQEATTLAGKVYSKEYSAAKQPAQKQRLARGLFEEGLKTKDEPATRYALYQIAKKIAVGIGDVSLAIQITDAITDNYEVDTAAARKQLIIDIAPQVRLPDEQYTLARFIGRALEPLLKTERYDDAVELAALGLAAAKGSKDPDLLKQWTRRKESVAASAKAFENAKQALATLEKEPVDPAANAAAGAYYCFVRSEWDRGLPMLALGDNKALQELAEREVRGANSPAEKKALADAWYDWANTQNSLEKTATLTRLTSEYRRLLPMVEGLPKRLLEERLAEASAANPVFVKDEWTEILDLVDPRQHTVAGQWYREGMAIATRPPLNCRSFRIPVEVDGAYELRIRAERFEGGDMFTITLSHSANDAQFMFNSWGGNISGLSNIDGKMAEHNSSRTPGKPMPPHWLALVGIAVEPRNDQVTISTSLDKIRYSSWTGPKASLSPNHGDWRKSIHIEACTPRSIFYSVQLKVKSGQAWIGK